MKAGRVSQSIQLNTILLDRFGDEFNRQSIHTGTDKAKQQGSSVDSLIQ